MKKHFSEYELAINILARYLYEEDLAKRFPMQDPSQLSFRQFLRQYNSRNEYYQDNGIFDLRDYYMNLNVRIINKLTKDVFFLVANSYAVIPKNNAEELNYLFNAYCKKRYINRNSNTRRGLINDEFELQLYKNQFWQLYYRRMKYLERHITYIKCLLRKRKGLSWELCERIGYLLYPQRYKLKQVDEYMPVSVNDPDADKSAIFFE